MPNLYEITVPVFTRSLRNLDHILDKAVQSGMDEQGLIEARLAPDMLPLPRQIQIACDTAKLAITRIAQAEPRPMSEGTMVCIYPRPYGAAASQLPRADHDARRRRLLTLFTKRRRRVRWS